MSYKVILTKRANQDLQEITNYYSEQSKETTQRFLRTIIKDLDFLSENPKSCPVLFSKVRRKVMTHFPFNIFYKIKPRKQEILIARIWHQKRDLRSLSF